ncbi:MAG: C39 family peptidase [Elusimicrobia bacterium]|nr:C39 family peptidase [Elusimicrobiota bacterium]
MRAALFVVAVCLSGCGTPGVSRGAEGRRVRLDVPFFPDGTDQCGPSALASVLGYWGRPAAPSVLREELYRANLKGALTVDMLLAAEARGLSTEMADGGLERIKRELDAGHPLIAFIDVGFKAYPIGHYLVITGYDDGRRTLFAHSGKKRDRRISYAKFDRLWEKTNRWTLLMLPPA